MNAMTKPSIAKSGVTELDDTITGISSLLGKPKAGDVKEIVDTLNEYRTYCKAQKLEFLSYLMEMAVLEAMEVHASLQAREHQIRK